MCGRYTLATSADKLAAAFGLAGEETVGLRPSWNVAPSQAVAVVGLKPDGVTRGLARLKWGLVPSWANDPRSGPRPVDARADSLHKPTFRHAFKRQRCLIPADGFFEWVTAGDEKVPHHFGLKGGGPFALAGLWEVWGKGPGRLLTCCHITVEANDLVAAVHDRMPAILPPRDCERWLASDAGEVELRSLLRTYPGGGMGSTRVGPAVNSTKNNGPENVRAA